MSSFLPSHLFLPLATEYFHDLKLILSEFSTQKIYYAESSCGILKTLLIKLYRHSLQTADTSTDTINAVLNYIIKNYDKPITNKTLSEFTGYHENHLNKLFLNYAGTTMHKYLLTIRMNEAKKLLLNSCLDLHTIAEKVGFNSNTYFSNYFKQTEGMPPLEYRRKYQNRI